MRNLLAVSHSVTAQQQLRCKKSAAVELYSRLRIFRKAVDQQSQQQRACSALKETTQCNEMTQRGRMHLVLLQCTKKK